MRALGVGFPYAIANALFGGTAEYVALSLRSVGVEPYFFFYVVALAALTFIASALMPDLGRHGYLDGNGAIEENTGFKRGPGRQLDKMRHISLRKSLIALPNTQCNSSVRQLPSSVGDQNDGNVG